MCNRPGSGKVAVPVFSILTGSKMCNDSYWLNVDV